MDLSFEMEKGLLKCKSFKIVFLILVTFFVSGCAPELQKSGFPLISFAHLKPISLDVARVEVENNYVSPETRPFIEHEFPASLAALAMNWASDRLNAVGSSDVLRVMVRRASVVEVPLSGSGGLEGMFRRDQSERYDAVIELKAEIRDEVGNSRVTVETKVSRSQTVAENISLIERDKIWFDMTEAMMSDLNAELEKQIRIYMKKWIRK